MNRFWTLMVIPHNDDHVREFNLAAPFLWGVAALAIAFLVTACYFAYGYYARLGAELEYTDLKVENTELNTHLTTLRSRMTSLTGRVDDLRQGDTRMRAFARMTEPSASSDGLREAGLHEAGSENTRYGISSSDGYGSLGQLTREAKLLEVGFDSLLATLSNAGDALRHIPSIFPVRGEGWYSSTFGYRTDPITGQRSFNRGIDIAGRKGTAIIATADGKVDAAKFDTRLGHMVTIDHTNGFRTVYAHLEGHDRVKPGQTVSRGDIIGKMSRSGVTTAVHLHYAVIRDKKVQDPLKFIFDSRQRSTLF